MSCVTETVEIVQHITGREQHHEHRLDVTHDRPAKQHSELRLGSKADRPCACNKRLTWLQATIP